MSTENDTKSASTHIVETFAISDEDSPVMISDATTETNATSESVAGTETNAASESDAGSETNTASESDTGSDLNESSNAEQSNLHINTAHSEEEVIHLVDEITPPAKNKKEIFRKITFSVCCLGFVIFLGLFINEVFIQPARTNKVINEINDLYKNPPITAAVEPVKVDADSDAVTETAEPVSTSEDTTEVVVKDPNKDEQGRLLAFQSLLETNEDVKGWLTIPDTNMDYVVMQSAKDDPEFYLFKNIYKEYDKAGSLFLDYKSSVESDTQSKVIHGHNMTSTDNMFHYLLEYKDLDFFQKRPVIQFDTIYEKSQWKVFSVFITNGNSNNEPLFDYTRATFTDSSDFLNFIQDLKLRSYYHTDGIDLNEDDQILVLSTCSYELWDYRTVVVARKVREGEDPTVDAEGIIKKKTKDILYPSTWYQEKGGTKPEDISFEDALQAGTAAWYVAPVKE